MCYLAKQTKKIIFQRWKGKTLKSKLQQTKSAKKMNLKKAKKMLTICLTLIVLLNNQRPES